MLDVLLFTDTKKVKKFKAAHVKVFGHLGIIKIPFPLKPDDACAAYGLKCPSVRDERLSITIPILRTYPSIKLKIELRLLDEMKKTIICVEFPAKIQDKPSRWSTTRYTIL